MSGIDPRITSSEPLHSTLSRGTIQSEVRAGNMRFMEAARRGDAAGMAACYTRNAQLLPNHSDVVEGIDAIAAFWGAAKGLGVASVHLETVELDGTGDSVIEVGRYTLTGADGAPLDRGKYIVVWRREDGMLKLHRDIWTTSMPQPTT